MSARKTKVVPPFEEGNKPTRPSTKDDIGLEYASTNDDDRENGIGKDSDKNVHIINIKDAQDINDEDNIKKEEQDLRLIVAGPELNKKDWTTGFRGTVCSVAYFLITSVILMFFMNFVHQRMPRDAPALPDIGHQLIPKMQPEKLGDFTMMMLVFMLIVAMIFHKNRWPIIINFFVTLGNLYLIRVVSISVTSLPATNNHCRDHYVPIQNIYWNTLKGLITFGSSNIHCGDLMFSGHTCMVTNIWMTFMINYKKKYPITILATILLLLTFFFIIATRSHYTGDIWIAFWLTALMHKITSYSFPYTKKNIIRFLKTSF